MARGAQVLNHFRKQLLADTLSFKLWQDRQDDDFSSESVAEAVPNEMAAGGADVARTLSSANVVSPGLGGNSQRSKPIHGNCVLAGSSAQDDAIRGIGWHGASILHR